MKQDDRGSEESMAVMAILLFLLTMLIGLPIAFALGLSSVFVAFSQDYQLLQWAQRIYSGLDSFTLLAVPFFVLAGNIMNTGGITERLVDFAQYAVGRISGGLAQTNILVSMLFAGISGAAVADTSAIGSVLIPAMEKEGYDSDFSAAITVASSSAGPIIPPSILMVLYGVSTGTSIGALFLAGMVPGILLGVGLMIVTYIYARRRNYPRLKIDFELKVFLRKFKDVLIPLLAPVIIVGGIVGGIFTPTEAASVAVLYALIVTLFIYRELELADLPGVFLSSGLLSGVILLIIGFANTVAWIISMERVGVTVAGSIQAFTDNTLLFLLLINLFLLFIGMFMEAGAAIIILAPILSPLAQQYGIHPLHFGFVMVLNLTIALSTPPIGICLFVGSKISGVDVKRLSIAILPFLMLLIGVLLLVTYVPAISMWVPEIFGYYP